MMLRFSRGLRGLSFLLLPSPSPNWRITVESFTIHFPFLQASSPALRFSSSPGSEIPEQCSLVVSYLIKLCGLSAQSALSASRRLPSVAPERVDAVLSLFRNYGITDTQLRKLITAYPRVLWKDPDKTLLPKLRFFHSMGFTGPDIGSVLSSCPVILSRSLENQIIPVCDFFKSILGLDEMVVLASKRAPRLFLTSLNRNLLPKVKALREIGVPESSIAYLLRHYPIVLQVNHEKWQEILRKVVERGLDPMLVAFVNAVQVFSGMSESTWEQKMEVYRRWGLSNDEILLLFKRFPICLSLSEKNIMRTMDFLINKMGWELTAITRVPACLSYSLEMRIVPRCSVVKVLMLKGLVKQDLALGSFLKSPEQVFLERFVIKYLNRVPELLHLYTRAGVADIGFSSELMSGIKQL